MSNLERILPLFPLGPTQEAASKEAP